MKLSFIILVATRSDILSLADYGSLETGKQCLTLAISLCGESSADVLPLPGLRWGSPEHGAGDWQYGTIGHLVDAKTSTNC